MSRCSSHSQMRRVNGNLRRYRKYIVRDKSKQDLLISQTIFTTLNADRSHDVLSGELDKFTRHMKNAQLLVTFQVKQFCVESLNELVQVYRCLKCPPLYIKCNFSFRTAFRLICHFFL